VVAVAGNRDRTFEETHRTEAVAEVVVNRVSRASKASKAVVPVDCLTV
jgi:hypothetical protein